MQRRGFTLIELLIVVAIIAILAAIAIPNFLAALTRAKVSRVKADLRTLATAIESYTVDNNREPFDGNNGEPHVGWATSQSRLTTPIAYITSIFTDPFQDDSLPDTSDPDSTHFVDARHAYDYGTARWHGVDPGSPEEPGYLFNFSGSPWKIGSAGPDTSFEGPGSWYGMKDFYDPTNGTISGGDVYRSTKKFD